MKTLVNAWRLFRLHQQIKRTVEACDTWLATTATPRDIPFGDVTVLPRYTFPDRPIIPRTPAVFDDSSLLTQACRLKFWSHVFVLAGVLGLLVAAMMAGEIVGSHRHRPGALTTFGAHGRH